MFLDIVFAMNMKGQLLTYGIQSMEPVKAHLNAIHLFMHLNYRGNQIITVR